MKKVYITLIFLFIFFLVFYQKTNYATTKPIKIFMDNKELIFKDSQPFLYESKTMVPIRLFAENVGFNVDWDADIQMVILSKGEDKLYFIIEEKYLIANGVIVDIDIMPKIIDSTTYLPLRIVAEQMGLNINWKPEEGIVTISTGLPNDSIINDKDKISISTIDEYIIEDISRNRNIPIKIYYPDVNVENQLPLIIISHGLGGSKDALAYLGKYWAAHGYVCIHPTHIGSDVSLFQNNDNAINSLVSILLEGEIFSESPKDISLIIDNIDEIQNLIPNKDVKINKEKIGLAGHSFGAYTTIALAGGKVTLMNKQSKFFTDDRIKAFIALSPMGDSGLGLLFTEDSWDNINVPVMLLTGTKDMQPEIKKDYSWRIEPYDKMPKGDKYLAIIEDATHLTFTGDKNIDETIKDDDISYIKFLTLNFWNLYLLDENGPQKVFKNSTIVEKVCNQNIKYKFK